MMSEGTVLLVIDDADTRLVARASALAGGAGAVVEAIGAMGFADHLAAGPCDAVVLQWPLGWGDSAQAVTLVRKHRPGRLIAVVAESADDAGRAMASGVDRVVGNSVAGFADLQRVLDGWLRAADGTKHQRAPSTRSDAIPASNAEDDVMAAAQRRRSEVRQAREKGDETGERAALVALLSVDPADDAAWDRLIALDRSIGDEQRLADTLTARIPHIGDTEEMRRLSKQLLAVCIDSLRDGERALQVCLAWLDRDPDNDDLRRILIDMLTRLDRWPALRDVLGDIARRADRKDRAQWLLQLADVFEHRLNDVAGAAATIADVIALAAHDPKLADSLAALRARHDGLIARGGADRGVLQLVPEPGRVTDKTVRNTMAMAADALRATGPVPIAAPGPIATRAAAIAHDLSAPARAVARYIEAVVQDHGGALDPDASELLERAHAAASRMQKRVATVLGPPETGGEEIHVGDLLLDVIADLSALLDAHDASVEFDALPTVVCDRDSLCRVLQNLISNAVVHGGDAPRVQVSAISREDGWEFLVDDDGPGLPEGVQLFQPGVRGPSEHEGHGLGLAICRDLVDQLGGRIGARANAGGGTTVHFTLPDRRAVG